MFARRRGSRPPSLPLAVAALAQRCDLELAAPTSGAPNLSRYNWRYPAIRCEKRSGRPRQLDPTQIYRGE